MPPPPITPRPIILRPKVFFPVAPRPVPPFGSPEDLYSPQSIYDSIRDAINKAKKNGGLKGMVDRAAKGTKSFLDYVRDRIVDHLSRDNVPWIGKGQGGKTIQKGIDPVYGFQGKVDNAPYEVSIKGRVINYGNKEFIYTDTHTGPIGSIVLDADNFYRLTQKYGKANIFLGSSLGTIYRPSGIGSNSYAYVASSPEIVSIRRVDGATPEIDASQDPNQIPGSPTISQEPYGPIDTRGAKPPKPNPSPSAPIDGIDIPGAVWDHPGIGPYTYPPGYGGSGKPRSPKRPDPTPKKTPTEVPTRSPKSQAKPRQSPPAKTPSQTPTSNGNKQTQRPKEKTRTTQYFDIETGITYETTEYSDGSTIVNSWSEVGPTDVTVTDEGLERARLNHYNTKQNLLPGITPNQTPQKSNPTPPGRNPDRDDQRSPVPIINYGPVTINIPTPTQDPTPIQRPTPPKPPPIFQPIPTKDPTKDPTPNPPPTIDPTPPGDDREPRPPIFNPIIFRPPVSKPDPIPPISDALRADPVTGNPVKPVPTPEKPKAPPPVGNPGSGGSTCAWPADRGVVLGNQGTIQTKQDATNTTLGVVSTVQETITNVGINDIKGKIGNPIAGKASTIFDAIDNVSTFTEKFAKATKLDKVYNALTLFLVIHNASQLARNLGSSLDELINTGLQAIGIRDEKDEELSISGAIGKSVESFIRSIIGNDVYDGVSLVWKKGSAIYSASVNIADAITSPLAGLASGLSEVGNNTGKIGNALVKSGTVLENSYDKMSENIQVNTGKLAQLNNYIQSGDSAVQLVDSFTELARVPLETKEAFDNTKEELDGLKTKMNEEVTVKKTEDATAKTASESPDITELDVFKNLF